MIILDGIIIVNKEQGYTSNDVVQIVKKIFNEKVGHTGTLDPMATGVLPVLVGKGTLLSKYLINHDKIYVATLKLGIKTDTGDITGNIIEEKDVNDKCLQKENIQKVLEEIKGEQKQIPPMYSAIKVNGKKLYEYARKGLTIDIQPRMINIYNTELLNIDTAKLGYHSLYFANFKGTRYYVEGSFKVDAQISPWVWQGFGFGSGLSETSTRYFIFSPRVDGQGNDFNKFIVKDLPNETWPALTTRSQTWGENGLDNIDWRNNEVKVALLRDNNTYYYLLNDKLMYVDESTVYDEIPTMPILVSIDLPVTVKNYKLITEDAQIDAKLSEQQFKYSFYPSNEERVEYQSDSRFIFKSNNILSKDNKVKSLGDKAKLVGDFEVEFDIEDMLCNKAHTNGFSGIGLNLSRYDSADTVESFLVGNSVLEGKIENTARYNSWNYTMSYDNENSSYYYLESSTQLFENPKTSHHVKVTRTIENNISTFKMFVDETEVNFDLKSSKFEGMTSKYTGAYILWIAGEYASGEVNNLTFKSAINKGGN